MVDYATKASGIRISRVILEIDNQGLKMLPTPFVRIELLSGSRVAARYDIPETGKEEQLTDISLKDLMQR